LHRWSLRFSFSHAPASEFCTLSLHDALPIYDEDVLALELGAHRVELLLHRLLALLLARHDEGPADVAVLVEALAVLDAEATRDRSEEHTSELQSRENLVCRLLLEKKKAINTT